MACEFPYSGVAGLTANCYIRILFFTLMKRAAKQTHLTVVLPPSRRCASAVYFPFRMALSACLANVRILSKRVDESSRFLAYRLLCIYLHCVRYKTSISWR